MDHSIHPRNRAWQGNAEPDDQPTAADIDIEAGNNPDEGLPNELFDAPRHEDAGLHAFVEDMLSQTDYHEQLAGNIYSGTDNSDSGFYSDNDYGDGE